MKTKDANQRISKRIASMIQKNGSLADNHPELLADWDYEKNELTPYEYTSHSNKKVWWLCQKGHSWSAAIASRSKGHGCPYCAGVYPTEENNLKEKAPLLAAEWHPTKNGDLSPEMVSPYSMKKVWWKCSHGHEWQASVSNRFQGSRHSCKIC